METLVKLRITGKSTVVTIPKNIIEKLDWKIGNYIKLKTDNNQILLTKIEI